MGNEKAGDLPDIIHAEGEFALKVGNKTSSTPKGVRGGFTSSVGQACGERVGAVREEALDLYSCVFEILRADAELEDFFDYRRKVGQGLNGVERRKAWCAEKPAEDGQYHGVFRNAQRYPARMPLLGQKTVRTADHSRCARRYTIGI